MATSISEQCLSCIATLKAIFSALSSSSARRRVSPVQINEELERLSLWIGNIGALHVPESPLSMESRLREAKDVLEHIQELLSDLDEVAGELLKIATGEREGEVDTLPQDENLDEENELEEIVEERELLQEIGACIARLFRASSLIRQAAPIDLFSKALSRNRLQFSDEFDIGHVSHKFPKLAVESKWLLQRLGRAITTRRQYISYIQHHRDSLDRPQVESVKPAALTLATLPIEQPQAAEPIPLESASRPSTYITKASTLAPDRITAQMLTVEDEESDPEEDARSYTTISRSVDGNNDSSTFTKIPKLSELRVGAKNEVECPFCFRMKKFKNEKVWRQHVFSDLRSYVCTFPECDAHLFGDINEWFRHEMQNHRVSYVCRFCSGKAFGTQDKFVTHLRRQHDLLGDDGQSVLEISRKPVDIIPAQDCPCCDDWVQRLQGRESMPKYSTNESEMTITVTPAIFKRHLAAHLESLSLFAVPIGSPSGGNADSNMAIEETDSELSRSSDLSTLVYDSEDVLMDTQSRGEPVHDQQISLSGPTLFPDASGYTVLNERELWLVRKVLQKWVFAFRPRPTPIHFLHMPCHRVILQRNLDIVGAMTQYRNEENTTVAKTFRDVESAEEFADISESEGSETTVIKDPPSLAYKPVSSRFIVYTNTKANSPQGYELNFEEGQPIYITHKRDGPMEPYFYGYNPETGEGGAVHIYNVTTPFMAVFKDTFTYTRLNCAVCQVSRHSHIGDCTCGSDAAKETEPQYVRPGVELLVTRAISGDPTWKGYYFLPGTRESVLVQFESNCVVRKDQQSAEEHEVTEAPNYTTLSRFYGPIYESIESPTLFVSKEYLIPAAERAEVFLRLRPGLVLQATHTALLTGSRKYYYGHPYESSKGESEDTKKSSKLFSVTHVVPRVSKIPIEGDWDHDDTVSVRISQETRSKLSLACMAKLLVDLEVKLSCSITTEEESLKIKGEHRFDALETAMHYAQWPIDVNFEEFQATVTEKDVQGSENNTLTVGDCVRVLNYGPNRDWYFGITDGPSARILVFPNTLETLPPVRRPPLLRPSTRTGPLPQSLLPHKQSSSGRSSLRNAVSLTAAPRPISSGRSSLRNAVSLTATPRPISSGDKPQEELDLKRNLRKPPANSSPSSQVPNNVSKQDAQM